MTRRGKAEYVLDVAKWSTCLDHDNKQRSLDRDRGRASVVWFGWLVSVSTSSDWTAVMNNLVLALLLRSGQGQTVTLAQPHLSVQLDEALEAFQAE